MSNTNVIRDDDVNVPLSSNQDTVAKDIRASAYTQWLIANRKLIIFMTVLLLAGIGFGASKLGLTTDNRVFFGKDNPQLKTFEKFESIYTENNNVVVAFAPKSGSVFSNDTLAAIELFTKQAWKLPFSSRVDSLTNFQHTYATNDDLVVKDLVSDAQKLSTSQLESIRQIALNEPLVVNRLVSPDSSVAAVNINFILANRTDEKSINEIVTALRALTDKVTDQFPDVNTYMSGDIVLGAAIGEATQDDVSLLIPAMFLLILLVIGVIQRSVTALIATLSIIILTIVTTMGLAGWLGYILNPGSAIAPTIVITLCAAYCVHIINSVLNNSIIETSKISAIASAIQHNISAVLLTCLTTIIGFLSMLFSDSPPFHDLGILVSIGVAVTFVYVFTVLPVILYLLPVKPSKNRTPAFSNNPVINQIIKLAEMKSLLTIAGLVLVMGTAIFGISKLNLADDWVEYFDERYTFRNDSDYIIQHMSGIESLEFSLNSGEENGVSSPEFLSMVDNFTTWLREQEGVDYVYSLSNIIKRINKNMHGDDPSFYRIPENKELAAQYLLLYEMSLPYGLGLDNYMDLKKTRLRVNAVGDLDTVELRELEERANHWLSNNSPQRSATDATGMSLIFAHISGRNIETMMSATLGALILISIILIFALKSVKLGLISLIPNIIPAAVAIGLWGWFYGELGMAIAVVGAMTLGIIVDDTIHFMLRFKSALTEKFNDPVSAIRYAFDSVGGALFTTTCALVAGFGILAFSGFQVNWGMGLLAAMTIAIALIVDFVLLPLILVLAYKKRPAI